MKDNFESIVLPFTLRYEGGWADDPRDPGGRTNQGVTQTTYSAYRRICGQSAADVFDMADAERNAIYRGGFWNAVGGDGLPAGVDLACFDLGVNSGPARAITYLKVAGGAAAATADPAATVKAVCAKRLSFLHALHTFETFGRGWTARVAACEALGVKMALNARVGQPAGTVPSHGTALVLRTEAKAATAKAAGHLRTAQSAGAGGLATGAGGPLLAATQTTDLPWLLAGLLCAGLAATAALLAWRAWQHRARAQAYTALASTA